MKIYVVIDDTHYECSDVLSVHATMEGAKAVLAAHKTDNNKWSTDNTYIDGLGYSIYIEEHEVQE